MSKDNIVIREIRPEDNPQIEAVIKDCFHEFKIPLKGTAYEDAETPLMFESYQGNKEVYFVVANEKEVLGGGGIKQLSKILMVMYVNFKRCISLQKLEIKVLEKKCLKPV